MPTDRSPASQGEKVWRYWTEPDHITKWNQASEDWHTPRAENDLRVGGKLLTRMEAKDGSMGFDFGGAYDVVNRHEVIETFDAESSNPVEFQQAGWQAIMDNFKAYTEQN
ncbi:SRPBCC domain-containing protein [Paenibacillus harenae]|uniref:SRPBCC domain-containing protein n=1 Tax=Paenibacillus harenae TaxID=306543 RepID=UPI0027945C05|nr:SRPBCC domain-containing protein [Paenibacillus harenae]MDQ0063345.1 uncharacterized protein YndB with AHSA1/START domain [Paenibacillus harenae]